MNFVNPNEKTTLLLNNAWQPITVITARAAFMHTLKGRATCLDKNMNYYHSLDSWQEYSDIHDDQPALRSANKDWKIPTLVIVTSKFFRRPKKKKLSLYELAKYHKNVCQYCMGKFKTKELTIDHVVPRSKGGQDTQENRVLCCRPCNQEKGNLYPWFKKNENMPSGPVVPSFIFEGREVRDEWKPYLKGFC